APGRRSPTGYVSAPRAGAETQSDAELPLRADDLRPATSLRPEPEQRRSPTPSYRARQTISDRLRLCAPSRSRDAVRRRATGPGNLLPPATSLRPEPEQRRSPTPS